MYGGYNVVVEIRTATSRDLHLAPPCQPPPRSTRAIHDDVETAAALLSLAREAKRNETKRGEANERASEARRDYGRLERNADTTPPWAVPLSSQIYTLETRSRRHEQE